MASKRHRSSATPLALAYAALVLYASLYPLVGWRWPNGQELLAVLLLPWTSWRLSFDLWSNVLGYVPLGLLIAIAALRSAWPVQRAMACAVLAPVSLSYLCEALQHFMPGRVPAMEDFLTNSAGAALGAMAAWAANRLGWVGHWTAVRRRWFAFDGAGALALFALWPVGLLFPAPLPLGMGQIGERLREWLADLLEGVPWAEVAYAALSSPAPPAVPLRPLGEGLVVALGLLAPCVVVFSIMRPGWRRALMALATLALALSSMTISTALNFGPSHATGWLAPAVLAGLCVGGLAALAMVPVPQRVVSGLGLVVITGLVAGVAQAPSDPYFAQSLQAWEQGRFVRFHGLAQWVGWVWPFAALAWLLSRLSGQRL